jgi:hypothetical protein
VSSRAPAGAVAASRFSSPGLQALSFRSLAFLFVAVTLADTLRLTQWHASDESFELAALCFALLLVGVSVNRLPAFEAWFRPAVVPLLAFAFTLYIRIWQGNGPSDDPVYAPLVTVTAVLFGIGLVGNRAIERWRVPLLLAVHVGLGVWRIQASPSPHIDVWVWHNEAIEALFAGKNPYAITMPNIYDGPQFYDPTMVVNGRVLTGYQYPPLSLLFAIPGYVLGGDYRYSELFAMTVAGGCMAYARLGTLGASAMALWLFSPGCLFVLEQGYTEPMLVMLMAATLLCAVRRPGWLFVPLGLLFAAKQYMLVITAPLIWLLPWPDQTPGAPWRLLLRAAAVATALTLPFFVINPKALFDCLVLLQLRQPFRLDSLSVPAWWMTHYGKRLPDWLGFASIVPFSMLALRRCERSASGFAAGLALVSFAFFVLSKQAFSNYYFFNLGAICSAVAFAGVEPPPALAQPAARPVF